MGQSYPGQKGSSRRWGEYRREKEEAAPGTVEALNAALPELQSLATRIGDEKLSGLVQQVGLDLGQDKRPHLAVDDVNRTFARVLWHLHEKFGQNENLRQGSEGAMDALIRNISREKSMDVWTPEAQFAVYGPDSKPSFADKPEGMKAGAAEVAASAGADRGTSITPRTTQR